MALTAVRVKQKIKLTDVKITFYVRKSLDEDYVVQLGELIESGVELPPIEITEETHELIDGRHRYEAHVLVGKPEITYVTVPQSTQADLIAHAFAANLGGSKPPSRADIEYTVGLLIRQNVPTARILTLIPFPPSLVRKYIRNVQSKHYHARLAQALNAVSDGMTVQHAAERYNVDVSSLRVKLRGKAKKVGIAELKAVLVNRARSFSTRNAAAVRKLMEQFEDGEASEYHVLEFLTTLSRIVKQINRAHANFVQRFEVTRAKHRSEKSEKK